MSLLNFTPDYFGTIAICRTVPTTGSVVYLPAAYAQGMAPENKVRPGNIDSTVYQDVEAIGMRTPSVNIAAYAHPSWFTAAVLNDLIAASGTTSPGGGPGGLYFNLSGTGYVGQTGGFSIMLNNLVEPSGSPSPGRIFDVSRCMAIQLSQDARGGPIMVQMSFRSLFSTDYQDTVPNYDPHGLDQPIPTIFGNLPNGGYNVFNLPGSPPPPTEGELYNITQTNFVNADYVASWTLTLMRAQNYVAYFTTSKVGSQGMYIGAQKIPYCQDIATGIIGGSMVIAQSPTNTVPPQTGAGVAENLSFTITAAATPPDGTGVMFALQMSEDGSNQPQALDIGRVIRSFAVMNPAGGSPVAITAY